MTASTSEAYSWLFKLLCDPGDEVLVPRPSYPLFEYLARLESVEVRHYGVFYDHGWFIDFHALEQAIGERTRAIVVVNPDNPTGHFIRRHELEQLSTLCARHDLALISDEVFSDYLIEPAAGQCAHSAGNCRLHAERAFEAGWVAADEAGVDDYQASRCRNWRSLRILIFRLALRCRWRCRAARIAANDPAADSRPPAANRPGGVEAGWYAVLPAPDDEETAFRLLRDDNILVQPGYFYDFEARTASWSAC